VGPGHGHEAWLQKDDIIVFDMDINCFYFTLIQATTSS
jgi:hypothetical protein